MGCMPHRAGVIDAPFAAYLGVLRIAVERAVTPDGITTEDWDRIHQLALDVVNASADGDTSASDAASLRLREVLDELQEKYGPLPSLLATRADYVTGTEERDYGLTAAYEQAAARGDIKNLVWISSSLACLHLEDAADPARGKEWLTRLEGHLRVAPDESEAEEAVRLRELLNRLQERPQNNKMQRTKHG
jgi:hypothetical protein